METRARYILIGAFALGVLTLALTFVYWLNTIGGLSQRSTYRVQFYNPVSGLLIGSPVLFNGIRVGEVARLELDPARPREVSVTISVDLATPIRSDTVAEVDFQGLAGAPVVLLSGRESDAPKLPIRANEVPVLEAAQNSGQSMTQSARDTLNKLNKILDDSAEPLRSLLADLGKFSNSLARNSDRADSIAAGLERMTGGTGKAKAASFDLTAPQTFSEARVVLAEKIAVPEPAISMALGTDAIQVRMQDGGSRAIENAQWSDSVPSLIQSKIVETFERAGYQDAVSRQIEGIEASYRLLIEVRRFEIDQSGEMKARVEFSARVVPVQEQVLGSKTFAVDVPVSSLEPSQATTALNVAFGKVASELVTWTVRTLNEQRG